ncbi:alkaline dihydroceramidase Ydc1 [Venturia nashicola]|uniref:Alkaline dihydroceramidase Ydc1 n=1 Tax=Venturia nashicola TaxID=86259 RepID=A0A4Z1NYW2_9PEZI|nr:alkaline dihydroceramidase Ydc1 [Venturia nashicola]TLD25684.1 alkaline dihydroceramidase Ydc1 [Venturia nashicola]
MQLLDELSMIYCSCVALYAVISPDLSKTARPFFLAFVISLAIFISGYYHFLQKPEFHQTCFAIIVAIVSFKNMYTMETKLRPQRFVTKGSMTPPYDGKNGNWDVKRNESWIDEGDVAKEGPRGSFDERKRAALKNMWILVAFGLGTIGVGFFVWNLDTIYCSHWRRWRRQLGLPWGVLLEGHAWWHILTGLAAYYLLTWGVYLRYCLEDGMDEVRLVWPSLWTTMPTVEKRDKTKL